MKRTFKKILCTFLIVVMCLTSTPLQGFVDFDWNWLDFSVTASALAVAETGECGNNVYWNYDSTTKELVISGSGAIKNYISVLHSPFYESDIESVVINRGVTGLGSGAFKECSSLQSITIPDSVTSIGSSTFYNCTSLTSITIPDSVTSIGSNAFRNCTSLTSITIPDSVTSIGSNAFYNCTSLMSITIPDSVTTISDYAFCNCTSLTSITIPDSVTSIYRGVFTNTGYYNDPTNWEDGILYIDNHLITAINNILENYTIKDGTKTIALFAFNNCSSLTNITIPDSVTSIVGLGCQNPTDVYYQGTEEQWKKIYSDLYDAVFNPTIHIHYSSTQSKGETYYSNHANLLNAHMVKVVDKNGNPIGDATVTVDGKQHKTSPDGIVSFTTTASKATIGVIKNGYLPINNDKLEHTLSQTGSTLFVMYEIGDNTPYNLQSAVYSDSLNEVNVLYGIKRISLKNESSWIDNGKFNLKCAANVPSAVYKYELWQNKTEIAASTDGEFTGLEIGDFKKGGDVKVRVYKDKKNFISNSINLKFEEDKKIEGTSLSLGGSGLSLSFDDSIPYLGGSEVSIDFPDLPIEVYMETGENGKKEVHVGVNAKLYDAEKEMNGKWSQSEKKSWKEQVDKNIKELNEAMDILRLYKGGLTKKEKSIINNAINRNDKSNIPGLDKCSISFIGYGKGEYVEGIKESVEVDLYVIADLQGYGMTQQFMVWIVPFVVDIEANLGLSSEVKGKWDLLKDNFTADWKLNIKPSLEAFAGPGIGKVVNVGATGEAVLDIEVQLLGTNTSTGVNSINLEGSLGVSATFGVFEFKKNFMKDTWHLYTRNTKKMMYAKSPTVNSQTEIYNLDNYSLHDLSYLENESEWISQPVQTYSRTRNTDNGTYNDVNILLSNTYKNMQPMIVTTKDNTVVSAFLRADISRNIYNAPIAMYSVYDSETNSWATPVPFDNNNTSDSVPYLYTDGNDIYAVYLDSSETITENDSIDDYAIKQNITVAKFNKATGGFDSIEIVESAEDDFKANPQITVIDNIPTVVWQSNTNDPFGLCDENTLYKSEYIDGNWSDKNVIVDNQNGIVGLATDSSGIAYIIDGDNNFATTEDRTIYLSDNYKDFAELESGVVSNPIFSENGKLFWYSNGTLKTYEDETINLYPDGIIGFTDKFDIINNKVYYIGSSDEGKNLFVLTYDENANTWTAPVQITNQTKDIDYFTVGNIGGQTIAAMTLREYTITEDVFEDTCDLAYVILEEKHDVKVEYVDYEHDDVIPSSNLPLTVGVTNNGSTKLEEFEITVSDAEENLVCTNTYKTSLNPGESSEYIVEMPLGEEITLGNYKVSINETEYYDADSSNNSKEITIGYCNFEVIAEPVIINDMRYAIINVTNKSYTKSTGSLNIYNVLNPDEPVDSVAIEELAYGESLIYQLPIDNEILGGDEDVIAIKAVSDIEQYNSYSCQEELYFDISTSTTETYKAIWIVDDEEEIHTYEEGDVIEVPENPQKEGFYFTGWTPIIPETMPSENVTFTAQWLSIDDPKACELFGCKYTAVVTPSTCITKGHTTYTCSVCGKSYIDDYVDKIEHEYTSEITTPATHITEGVETFTCECGDSYTKPVEKLKEHTYETVVTAPTCTEKGYTTYTCECGDSYVGNYVNKLDHKYVSEITTPATHFIEGVETFTCKCGDSYTRPVKKLEDHIYEIIVTAPTCTEEGFTTYTCECGDNYTADHIAAIGHSDNNDDSLCDNCGLKLSSGEDDYTENCSCNCHRTGIASIIWKILRFFYKLFKINPVCGCGVSHY